MKFRREETFRYEFVEELKCSFKIVSIGGKLEEEIYYDGNLIDVSPNGFKIFSEKNIPSQKAVIIFVEFMLNDQALKLSADMIWKRDVGNGFHYGLKHHGTKEEIRLLIDQLKIYAKNYNQKKS